MQVLRTRLAAAVIAALALAAAGPTAAFQRGVLKPAAEAALRRAGYAGVPAERAFHLPASTAADPFVFNVLVLLVEFADVRADREADPPSAYSGRIFGTGGAPGSLGSYLAANSAGRLEVAGLITRWVRLDSSYASYAGSSGGLSEWSYPHNVQRLVEEAVARVAGDYRWEEFDNNRDGLVDGLIVIHAGPGVDERAPLDDPANRGLILAHQFHTSFEVPVPGSKVFDYVAVSETAPVGVLAHEVGHLLGLIDLYQAGAFVGPDGPFGIGDWSLMGTGALLDGGRTPANLDAWSRKRLGFVDVERITATTAPRGFFFPPDVPRVLELWGGGGTSEYFLVEARFRRGQDAFLPGEGVIVYHVDETMQTNTAAGHYKVGVEQADGRDDLGSASGNRGDAGDPWPSGSSDCFDAASTPASRAYSGADSRVTLANIRWQGSACALDLEVTAPPAPHLAAFRIRDVSENGNGFVEAGEEGAFDVTVGNSGAPLRQHDLTVTLSPLGAAIPFVTMLRAELQVGNLEQGEAGAFRDAFRFQLGADYDGEPAALPFRAVFAYSACPGCPAAADTDTVLVAPGVPHPLYATFTGWTPGWTHASLTTAAGDPWHLSQRAASSPPSAYFCGREDGTPYASGIDAVLVSPVFQVPPRGQLTFRQAIEAESLGTGRAWDGGRVEISVAGGPWRAIDPPGGYPFEVETGSGNALFGQGVFSGHHPDFARAFFDLSEFEGQALSIRFRFASDYFGVAATAQPQTGWFIDDVAVTSGLPALAIQATQSVPTSVDISWSIIGGGALAGTFEVSRTADLPGASPEIIARPSAGGSAGPWLAVDRPPAAGRWIYAVRIVTWEGPGPMTSAAPIEFRDPTPTARLWPPFPAPFRPSGPALSIDYFVPEALAGHHLLLDVIDIQGRLVTRLLDEFPAAGAARCQWTGSTPGGPLRSGLYFIRLKLDGQDELVRRFMVVS